MRKVFEQESISILPIRNGVLAVVVKEKKEDALVVAYQVYSLETGQIEPVTRFTYLLYKFGNFYQLCEKQIKDYLSCFHVLLPDDRILVVYPTGAAVIYTLKGTRSWQGELAYQGHSPTDGVFVGGKLWLSYSQANALICYDLTTMRQQLRIGGNPHPSFLSPEGLWPSDIGTLIVCNPLAHKIREVNLDTFEVEEYLVFDEPVYQYIKINGSEFVRLESGVYRL